LRWARAHPSAHRDNVVPGLDLPSIPYRFWALIRRICISDSADLFLVRALDRVRSLPSSSSGWPYPRGENLGTGLGESLGVFHRTSVRRCPSLRVATPVSTPFLLLGLHPPRGSFYTAFTPYHCSRHLPPEPSELPSPSVDTISRWIQLARIVHTDSAISL